MQTRIQRWGNSLALRIPRAFALETMLQQDSLVDLTLQGGTLVVTLVPQTCMLDGMLAQITPDNLHGEIEFGPAEGREAW